MLDLVKRAKLALGIRLQEPHPALQALFPSHRGLRLGESNVCYCLQLDKRLVLHMPSPSKKIRSEPPLRGTLGLQPQRKQAESPSLAGATANTRGLLFWL